MEPDQLKFYQKHLNQVSRSFALIIEQLESRMRRPVSLAYLLCRVVDTIEDSFWETNEEQQKAFDTFQIFLSSEDGKKEDWEKNVLLRLQGKTSSEELALLDAAPQLFLDFHKLPSDEKKILSSSIQPMVLGMKYFSNHKTNQALQLKSVEETNQYCFFVAGVVGELLTELYKKFHIHDQGYIEIPSKNFFSFGLFLQKINLLKDHKRDLGEGRSFFTEKTELLYGLLENAEDAFVYIQALSKRAVSYRLFCAWSFFLGLKSLPGILKENGFKLSRTKALFLFQNVKSMILNSEKLQSLYEELILPLREYVKEKKTTSPHTSTKQFEEWFFQNFSHRYDKKTILALRLLSTETV